MTVEVDIVAPEVSPDGSKIQPPTTSVVDLFCGAGGLSHGFLLEGFDIAAGFDVDENCRYPFEANNDAPLYPDDVAELTGERINAAFGEASTRVLVGCAPCQPFSKYSQGRIDDRWSLLDEFARLIVESEPDVVSMENVPRLCKFDDGKVFDRFVRVLRNADYFVDWSIAYCPDYGIPQSRSRLVLLASRLGEPGILAKTHIPEEYVTVADAIGGLPPIEAGAVDVADPLHRASALSTRNAERIRASRPGGNWRDWDPELVTECHRKASGKGYSSVYGRMRWDDPSPTMTTQFFGFGNGRFGHPEQDRAISLREGAILQSFPPDYRFVEADGEVRMKTIGRLIGNAVPVGLGRTVAKTVHSHLRDHGRR